MKIGTRSSTMALAQTCEVIAQLRGVDPASRAEVAEFTPRGDRDQTAKLDRHGGKGGAFVAEIRAGLLDGRLDAAMHSLKDVPGDEEAPGLVFAAYLKREAAEDALVLRDAAALGDFVSGGGKGFKIGTNSVRRAALLRRLYPHVEIIHYRGAADTRIKKLDDGAMQRLPDGEEVGPADGLVMAKSGLMRVGLGKRITKVFNAEEMLPAVGQGIVVVECAAQNFATRATLARINDAAAEICGLAEREVLWLLNGHCNTPIAGHARIVDEALHLDALVLSLDGATMVTATAQGDVARPRELGRQVALELLEKGAGPLIDAGR